jgi:hypothetical protein
MRRRRRLGKTMKNKGGKTLWEAGKLLNNSLPNQWLLKPTLTRLSGVTLSSKTRV